MGGGPNRLTAHYGFHFWSVTTLIISAWGVFFFHSAAPDWFPPVHEQKIALRYILFSSDLPQVLNIQNRIWSEMARTRGRWCDKRLPFSMSDLVSGQNTGHRVCIIYTQSKLHCLHKVTAELPFFSAIPCRPRSNFPLRFGITSFVPSNIASGLLPSF